MNAFRLTAFVFATLLLAALSALPGGARGPVGAGLVGARGLAAEDRAVVLADVRRTRASGRAGGTIIPLAGETVPEMGR